MIDDEERVRRYLQRNPNASVAEVAGGVGVHPTKAAEMLESVGVEADSPGATPRGNGAEDGSETATPGPEPSDSTDTAPDSIAEHYERLGELYEELGQLGSDLYCPGNSDFLGWYHTRPVDGHWTGEGRTWALAREYDDLRDELDRVLYATVNYAPAKWFLDAWTPYEHTADGREWDGENPTPGYGDLGAYAPFADIDLADGVKEQRPEGDIPREKIEQALSVYTDAFADLAGGDSHVFALDSVGGAYVMVAPAATKPIADELGRADRALLFEDMMGRLNQWLDDVNGRVHETVPEVSEIFEADLVNNKNRLYKAPLSVHSSLDGVVTPIDPSDPDYSLTPLTAASDALVDEAKVWADEFTDESHSEAVGALVSALWPDEYDEAGDWKAAVENRVEELRAEEKENRERQRLNRIALEEDLPDDVETTSDLDVLKAALERIDVADLAERIADGTNHDRDPMRFDPPWRRSSTGESCFADSDKFVDLKEGGGGGALTLIAVTNGHITSSTQTPKGEGYWKAVNDLRKLSYDIPYFEGSDGSHPDVLRLFDEPEDTEDARRRAVLAMRASARRS